MADWYQAQRGMAGGVSPVLAGYLDAVNREATETARKIKYAQEAATLATVMERLSIERVRADVEAKLAEKKIQDVEEAKKIGPELFRHIQDSWNWLASDSQGPPPVFAKPVPEPLLPFYRDHMAGFQSALLARERAKQNAALARVVGNVQGSVYEALMQIAQSNHELRIKAAHLLDQAIQSPASAMANPNWFNDANQLIADYQLEGGTIRTSLGGRTAADYARAASAQARAEHTNQLRQFQKEAEQLKNEGAPKLARWATQCVRALQDDEELPAIPDGLSDDQTTRALNFMSRLFGYRTQRVTAQYRSRAYNAKLQDDLATSNRLIEIAKSPKASDELKEQAAWLLDAIQERRDKAGTPLAELDEELRLLAAVVAEKAVEAGIKLPRLPSETDASMADQRKAVLEARAKSLLAERMPGGRLPADLERELSRTELQVKMAPYTAAIKIEAAALTDLLASQTLGKTSGYIRRAQTAYETAKRAREEAEKAVIEELNRRRGSEQPTRPPPPQAGPTPQPAPPPPAGTPAAAAQGMTGPMPPVPPQLVPIGPPPAPQQAPAPTPQGSVPQPSNLFDIWGLTPTGRKFRARRVD